MANKFQINRLVVNGEEIFNISDSTAGAPQVEKGKLFYGKTGAITEGTDPKISAFETLKVTQNNTIYDAPVVNDIHTVYSSVVVDIPTEELTVTENKTYYAPSKTVGYSPVKVDLPTKELTVTDPKKTYEAKKDNVYGYSKVNVEVPIKDKVVVTSNTTIKAEKYTVNGKPAAGIKEIEVALPLAYEFRADQNHKEYRAEDYGFEGFGSFIVEVQDVGGSGGGGEFNEEDLKAVLGEIDTLVSGSSTGILSEDLKAKLRNIIQNINTKISTANTNVSSAVDGLISKYDGVVSERNNLSNTVNSQQDRISNLTTQLTNKKNELAAANTNLDKANQANTQLREELTEAQDEIARLEALKEIEAWDKRFTIT